MGRLEAAMHAVIAAEPIERKVREAQKAGRIAGETAEELVRAALEAGAIAPAEHVLLQRAARLRNEVIRVDDFPQDLTLVEASLPASHRAAA
jgi:acyl-CoA dehydrogenase